MARKKKVVEEAANEKVVEPTHDEMTITQASPVDAMNEYANRVWDGQSVDLPKPERIHRVKEALKGQGYSDTDLQYLRIGNA